MNKTTEQTENKRKKHFLYYIFQYDRKNTIFPVIMIKNIINKKDTKDTSDTNEG